jgi:hypothetical protein
MSAIEIHDSDSGNVESLGDSDIHAQSSARSVPPVQPKLEHHPISLAAHIPTESVAPKVTNKRKGKATPEQISITRQLKVDEIIHLTSVPPTFDVPRNFAAILLDLSNEGWQNCTCRQIYTSTGMLYYSINPN